MKNSLRSPAAGSGPPTPTTSTSGDPPSPQWSPPGRALLLTAPFVQNQLVSVVRKLSVCMPTPFPKGLIAKVTARFNSPGGDTEFNLAN